MCEYGIQRRMHSLRTDSWSASLLPRKHVSLPGARTVSGLYQGLCARTRVFGQRTFLRSRCPEQVTKACALACVRIVPKPHLFCSLGLAFERKADAPIYCKQTKIEGSDRGFGVVLRACKAGGLRRVLRNLVCSLPLIGRSFRCS